MIIITSNIHKHNSQKWIQKTKYPNPTTKKRKRRLIILTLYFKRTNQNLIFADAISASHPQPHAHTQLLLLKEFIFKPKNVGYTICIILHNYKECEKEKLYEGYQKKKKPSPLLVLYSVLHYYINTRDAGQLLSEGEKGYAVP